MSVFDYLAGNLGPAPEESPPCPFAGGYLGWFGYELRHDRRSATTRRAGTPDAQFVMVDRFIAIDHEASETYVVAVHDGAGAEAARCWVDRIMSRLRDLPVPSAPAPGGNTDRPLKFFLHRDRSRYMAGIRQCLDWIRCGEAYQICLTNEITCEVTHDPLALYRVMRDVNPAPFAAFLRWPGGAVLSASPERFLAVDRNGRVETKPIKGTIRRDSDPIADRRLAAQLRDSEKDRAENVMIVDLLRNDLSRVCVPGSVVVSKLFDVETYATVHQLVSTVRGELGLGRTSVDLVRATFPGGSMTGAPKLRALDLIDELEGRARGIYSGAIGWLGNDGAMDLSIAIRTAVSTGNRLSMGVGGGVVAQSTPAGEFDEMVLKAAASIKAIVTAVCGIYDPALADLDTIDGTSMTRQSGS